MGLIFIRPDDGFTWGMDTNSVQRARQGASPPIAIAGVPFDPVTVSEALRRIERMLDSGGLHHVATANVDFLVQAMRDPELHRILCGADLVVCDGAPVVWASRLLGSRLPERVAGADLAGPLLALAARKRSRVFLMGGAAESAAAAAEQIRRAWPGIAALDFLSPPFAPIQQMNQEEICGRIREFRPDLLLVCMGCPKSEKWIAQYGGPAGARVAIGLGAVVDFLAGRVRRAPRWMRAAGMEWFFRLAQEPRRLAGRYVGDVMPMVKAVAGQWWRFRRLGRKGGHPPFVSIKRAPGDGWKPAEAAMVRVSGPLNAATAARYSSLFETAVLGERSCLLELAGVDSVDSAGIGLLLEMHRRLRKNGGSVALVAPSRPVVEALNILRLNRVFEIHEHTPAELEGIGFHR